jgi:hypothetical protein
MIVDSIILGVAFPAVSGIHILYLNSALVSLPLMHYVSLKFEERQRWMTVVYHLAKLWFRLDEGEIEPVRLNETGERDPPGADEI